MIGNLMSQLRIIFALVLREARVRHGRSRLGYLWTIIEPALMISFLTFLFDALRPPTAGGGSFAVFFATGVLSFQLFRNISQYVGFAFDANRPLLNYPPVKRIDPVIARAILEFSTNLLVIALVMSFQITVMDAPFPHSLPDMALVAGLLGIFGVGVGLCLAVARRHYAALGNVYMIVMSPAFFLSCVFYSLQSVPSEFRKYLVWNPLVHGVEGFRAGYYPGYRNPDLDLTYLAWWAFGTLFLGLLGERLMKKNPND
jgi:capsular polysaccharide transport system permease protein